MAQTPEQKAAKYLIDACADSRFNESALAEALQRQPLEVQSRFWNVIVSYVYQMSHWYEVGHIQKDTYQISRISKKIKDYVLSDEYKYIVYEKYGDYELEHDLTLFDTIK